MSAKKSKFILAMIGAVLGLIVYYALACTGMPTFWVVLISSALITYVNQWFVFEAVVKMVKEGKLELHNASE